MTEARLHLAVADFLRTALRDPVRWTAIQPERRGAIEGARMKRRGVQPGWPDFIVIWPAFERAVRPVGQLQFEPAGWLAIEVKTDKGRLSAIQRDFQVWATIHYAVVRSVDDVERALRAHGLAIYASALRKEPP